MKRLIAGIVLLAGLFCVAVPVCGAEGAESDKTLVAWVSLDDLSVRAGSVLTVQEGDRFDGIVFAEREPRTWMAGSNFFRRTQKNQDYPAETADGNALVQMAIVYEGNRISIYRNGDLLTSYEADNIDLLSSTSNVVVFGLRHLGGDGSIDGSIEDARIYARALTPRQIKSLRPNRASDIDPCAWWDFEGDSMEDRTGRFTHSTMAGEARLSDGRLVLGKGGVVVAARTQELAKLAAHPEVPPIPYEEQTPAMPDELPEKWLTYHLAHPGPGQALPGDPNAALFYKGRYHLHYIYRNRWGFCFAHLSSRDMVRWKWHPTKLVPPFTGHGMFSGTAFRTREGRPAIIYHGQGSGRNWLVFAKGDKLNQWTEPRPVVVKNSEGGKADIRHWDPDCWLRNDTYYAISGGRPPLLMKSSDLEEWLYLGNLFHEDTPWKKLGVKKNEDVSCANMFKIGGEWMLLCISHDLGCRYYLGDFEDEKYLPHFHSLMNWRGTQVFAPESLLTPDGRRIMWAWCRLDLPGGQTGIQCLPRELSLPSDGELRIRPLRELKKLRHDERVENDISVESGGRYRFDKIAGDTLELEVTIEAQEAREYGVNVFCDSKGNGVPIFYSPDEGGLHVGKLQAPLELPNGEDLHLRIFLDGAMIEVFANSRRAAVYGHPHGEEETGISLFSRGGKIQADVKSWQLRSIY